MSIRTIPLVLVAAAAMALATPAMAKVIEEATVCGADGCTKVKPGGDAHAMLEGGPASDAPKPAPFYRLRFGVGDGTGKVFERFWIVYVPSQDKIRAMDGQWVNTTTAGDRALDRVTRGHKPIPASKLKVNEGEQQAETFGTSLPPEIIKGPPPGDGAGAGSDGGMPGWLIVLATGGGLVLVAGGAAWALRRRTEGGGEAAVAP